MKAILLSIFLSLLLINFATLPGATGQCLSPNDDLSQPGSTDLSGILDFSLRLFQELAPKDEKTNFIFSPYSIWNALVLAYYGSEGQTEAQFRHVLGLGDKISTMKTWTVLKRLYKSRPESYGNTFILANRAYFDRSVDLRTCMKDILHEEIEKIDFGQSIRAADTINKFVSDTTRGSIDDLFSPSDIQNAIMALVNAAYFKGSWEYVFDERATRKAEFTGLDNTKYSVDMMNQIAAFKYGYDESLQTEIVELPYIGKSISMLIFLPSENTNLNRLSQGLSVSSFENIQRKLSPTLMSLSIPKFSLKFRSGNELIQALKKMGLTDPFDSNRANFGSFTTNRQRMSLDASVHEAFISVNEKGTVASAATGFTINKSGGIITFECNRPFLFAIRDNQTNNVLFMGAFKSSEQSIRSPGLNKQRPSAIGTHPNIGQNLNNGSPERFDTHVDRNNVNNQNRVPNILFNQNIQSNNDRSPTRGTHVISEQNYQPFNEMHNQNNIQPHGVNAENNPNRVNIIIPNQNNQPSDINDRNNPTNRSPYTPNHNIQTFGLNSENNPTRGTNIRTVENSQLFQTNNVNNPPRLINVIHNGNIQPSGNNNENNPSRGTITNPVQNIQSFEANNGNHQTRGIFVTPNRNNQAFGLTNENNPSRETNTKPVQIIQSFETNNGNHQTLEILVTPIRNIQPFGNNNENNPPRGTNINPVQNIQSFEANNGNHQTRGILVTQNRNNQPFANHNVNNPISGTNTILGQNNTPFGFNNENNPTKGTNRIPNHNIQHISFNNENNPNAGTNMIPNPNIPPFGFYNENNPNRRFISPTDQNFQRYNYQIRPLY